MDPQQKSRKKNNLRLKLGGIAPPILKQQGSYSEYSLGQNQLARYLTLLTPVNLEGLRYGKDIPVASGAPRSLSISVTGCFHLDSALVLPILDPVDLAWDEARLTDETIRAADVRRECPIASRGDQKCRTISKLLTLPVTQLPLQHYLRYPPLTLEPRPRTTVISNVGVCEIGDSSSISIYLHKNTCLFVDTSPQHTSLDSFTCLVELILYTHELICFHCNMFSVCDCFCLLSASRRPSRQVTALITV